MAAVCASGHPLTVRPNCPSGRGCHVCERDIPEGQDVWVCKPCNWWACSECSAPLAAAEKAEAEKAGLSLEEWRKKPGPPKVAYHPNVRCRRGAGCTCGEGPVIVGPMYRVGEDVCVCEGAASEEEKAKGPVEPAMNATYTWWAEGFDLRGWEAADILGLRGADGLLDLEGAILCGVDLQGLGLQAAILRGAQLQGAKPPKVAYHPDARCRRGDGCTCGEGPVIVGPMYRVGEVCVCEGAASEEMKAKGPVEPGRAKGIGGTRGGQLAEGLDLRGWGSDDIEGLRSADPEALEGAILYGSPTGQIRFCAAPRG